MRGFYFYTLVKCFLCEDVQLFCTCNAVTYDLAIISSIYSTNGVQSPCLFSESEKAASYKPRFLSICSEKDTALQDSILLV